MLESEKNPGGWDQEKGGWENEGGTNMQILSEKMKQDMHKYDASQEKLRLGNFDSIEAAEVFVQMIIEGDYSSRERVQAFEELSNAISRKIIDGVIERDMNEVD